MTRVMLMFSNLQHAFGQSTLFSVVWESTALRESTVVRIGFLYWQQRIKCSQCLYHRKMLTGEGLGGQKRSETLLTDLLGKSRLNRPLHEWHSHLSSEGYKNPREQLPAEMVGDCLPKMGPWDQLCNSAGFELSSCQSFLGHQQCSDLEKEVGSIA